MLGKDKEASPREQRCSNCGQVLEQKATQYCPGCGKRLAPRGFGQPKNVILGLLAGALVAFLLLFLASQWSSYGYTLVFLVPIAIGFFCGWFIDLKHVALFLILLSSVVAALGLGLTANISGLLCSLILLVVFVAPLLIGVLVGKAIRAHIQSRPRGGGLAMVVVLVLLSSSLYLESHVDPSWRIEEVQTSRTLELSARAAWQGVVFFEDVPGEKPFLLELFLPQPLYTKGVVEKVGDLKTCIYDSGHLTKRISEYRPNLHLAFDVVEQQGVEDRSVTLVDGSFQFQALGPNRTLVTLSTRYRPLLSARPVWRIFEITVAKTLHESVLTAIEERGRRVSLGEECPPWP